MRTMMMTRLSALILALAVVPACSKKEEEKKVEVAEKPQPKEKKAKEKKPKIKLPPLAPDSPRTAVGDVAVPAELEEEASRTVAIENLETELDRLEAEIMIGE